MTVGGSVGHGFHFDRHGFAAAGPGTPVRDDEFTQPDNPVARLTPVIRVTQSRPRPAVGEIAQGNVIVATGQYVVVPRHIIRRHTHRNGQQWSIGAVHQSAFAVVDRRVRAWPDQEFGRHPEFDDRVVGRPRRHAEKFLDPKNLVGSRIVAADILQLGIHRYPLITAGNIGFTRVIIAGRRTGGHEGRNFDLLDAQCVGSPQKIRVVLRNRRQFVPDFCGRGVR